MVTPRPESSDRALSHLTSLFVGFIVVATVSVSGEEAPPAESALSYDVAIEGAPNEDVQALLEELSEAARKKNKPISNIRRLRRRAERDCEKFLKVLRSYGYYGAQVTAETDEKVVPVLLTFRIEAGPPYLLQSAEVVYVDPPDAEPTLAQLGLALDTPAQAKSILDAEKRLGPFLEEQGFPFPEVGERKVVVDHASRSVDVTYHVSPGKRARFGATSVSGLETVKERLVLEKLPWKEDDVFRGSLLDTARNRLHQLDLFVLVRVKAVEEGWVEGRVPISIELAERKHRTIATGIEYSTDQGAGAQVAWENRNVAGLGRTLSIKARGAQELYGVDATYRFPEWRRQDQALRLQFRAGEETPDAYTSRGVEVTAWMDRKLSPRLTLGIGPSFGIKEEEQQNVGETYKLLALRTRLTWDKRDNPLNPTGGFRVSVGMDPFVDVFEPDLMFLKGDVTFSHYLRLTKSDKWVLANRIRLGSIMGAEREEVPPSVRFYAGGGGSIRGYEYQKVGPLFDDDDPIGGRSLFEVSLELRRKITDTIGIAAFIDGGSAFESSFSDFSEDIQWGAGIGARYYSGLGPLRLDIAVPLNSRDVDDSFQIYMSLGEAF